MNFDVLLNNPDLAKNIKFEITGNDLLELASTLINVSKQEARLETRERYLDIDQACKMLKRSRMTLHRWESKGILKKNQMGQYKESDIQNILNK